MYSAVSRFKSFSLRPPSACISALVARKANERRGSQLGTLFRWLLYLPRCFWNEEREKTKSWPIVMWVWSLFFSHTHSPTAAFFIRLVGGAATSSSIISILKTILCLLSLLRRLAASLEQFYFCCVENYTTRRRRRKNGFQKKRKLCPLASRTHSRAAPIPTLSDGLYTKKSIEIYFHV